MPKKFIYFLIVTVGLTGVIYYSIISSANISDGYCAFCNAEVLENQKFYEDNLVIALYTHKPVLPGHCLIIPKRHVERFENLTDDELTHINRVMKKVHYAAEKVFRTSSYLILQKNGTEVGQTVPHVHFHYISRKTGDDSTVLFMAKMLITNIQKPISSAEMHKAVTEMKTAMNNP